ncbi:unnamed protein product [Allacma fusca]|uniref:Uncharacterized protein n=1 Tax=Allacma fusca TaxID=39272 RepID=A0A8J2K4P3_9HEXA|nr:unnamed protein product [Allacma fusca]
MGARRRGLAKARAEKLKNFAPQQCLCERARIGLLSGISIYMVENKNLQGFQKLKLTKSSEYSRNEIMHKT